MLKTVSSITNAIGALNFKGTWNASTNTPTIVSGVGVKGDYFVVAVAGSTTIDGISNWGVGDWITYNGTVWQRVEGGADLNGVNLTVTSIATFAAGAVGTPAITTTGDLNTGIFFPAGDAVAVATNGAEAARFNASGNIVFPNGQGIDFSASAGGGAASSLLNDYEEGTWTPAIDGSTSAPTGIIYTQRFGRYTKIGRLVEVSFFIEGTYTAGVGAVDVTGLPFTILNVTTYPSISGGTGYLPVDTYFYAINNTTRLSAGKRSTGALSAVNYGNAGVSATNFQMLLMMAYFTN